MAGVVSPPLMGSHGVAPLTIVAPLPDICRHMANCITRAETEVFLATNFWIHSDASTLITNSFRELSRRAGKRGAKVVVKMIYDRGDPRQIFQNHLVVPEKQYAGGQVKLPSPEEIPNVDLQVINYHRPIFGTFHAKFMIVDRRIALLQSNNIQDNDNLEMMVRVEGPIVDSLYDSALVSWSRLLGEPLPLLTSPASSTLAWELSASEPESSSDGSGAETSPPQLTADHPHYDVDMQQETQRVNGSLEPLPGMSWTEAVTRHLSTSTAYYQLESTSDLDRHHAPAWNYRRCPEQ